MARGGKREGAGRPKGTGKYGEKTVPVRVPESMIAEVHDFVKARGYTLPLFSSKVQAGGPTMADAHIAAQIDLQQYLVPSPAESFLVRATGLSMKDIGIFPDDILVVDRTLPATNGKVVIAAVNGDVTVKRLQRHGADIHLLPENADFAPIIVTPDMDFHLWGVVTNVIHAV